MGTNRLERKCLTTGKGETRSHKIDLMGRGGEFLLQIHLLNYFTSLSWNPLPIPRQKENLQHKNFR